MQWSYFHDMGLIMANVGWSEYAEMLTSTTSNLFYYWSPDRSTPATDIVFPVSNPLQQSQGIYKTGFASNDIHKFSTNVFSAHFPMTQHVLEAFTIYEVEMKSMLSSMNDGLTAVEAAAAWVEQNPTRWGPWLPAWQPPCEPGEWL